MSNSSDPMSDAEELVEQVFSERSFRNKKTCTPTVNLRNTGDNEIRETMSALKEKIRGRAREAGQE